MSPAVAAPAEQGTVLRIERASIVDGHGLRTVVFLKGCPLICAWCSTPEGQHPGVETAGDVTYGRTMTVGEVMAEISKDEVFFFHSGGGVTLSGGEPLTQAGFAAAILRESRHRGIDTALETSLAAPYAELAKLLPYLGTLYADIKHMDDAAHREHCGASNGEVLANIARVAREGRGVRVVVRVPLVPGINDSDENLAATARFCVEHGIGAIELLPYHRLGVPTYGRLGREYPLAGLAIPGPGHLDDRRGLVRRVAPGLRVI
jgi:pyruvate formate lyase activating enzyme